MADWEQVLRSEYLGEAHSFTFKLCCGPGWDRDAFMQLFEAMHECCIYYKKTDSIPKWIVEIFWYLDWYVQQDNLRQWGSTENVPSYFQNAAVNLNHLAFSLFCDDIRGRGNYEPLDIE